MNGPERQAVFVARVKRPLSPRGVGAALLLAGLLWSLVVPRPASAGQPVLRFGSVAMDIPAVMYHRLSPLTRYLSAEVGREVVLELSPDMPTAIDRLVKGEVDLAYLTPVAYLRARERGGARLLVKTQTRGKGSFRLMIVVREGSPIREVAELRGRRFAFGDRAALLQRAVVVGAGMPLEELGEYLFIGHYDNIVRGVLNGDFDAGILKDTMAYKWQGKGIRILHASPELPPYNIAVRAGLDESVVERLRRAFLRLGRGEASTREVIHALDPKYDGFAPASDDEYDIVRRLVAPFQP